MAFKTKQPSNIVAKNPAAHFKTLTKRHHPDVMPHQKEILETYADKFYGSKDIALQLPTGSGKTLVGLLIADWRRIKCGDKVVYLCPTRQLVHQTVRQASERYGIDVVDLSGSKSNFPPKDTTAYKGGDKVAVSTYSGLFNTNPFFSDPDVVVVDDAHAAENYIANMWSLQIKVNTDLFNRLVDFLSQHLNSHDRSWLTRSQDDSSDTAWIGKLPSPKMCELEEDIIQIINTYATIEDKEIYYPWHLLRDHLSACHMYLSRSEILIRPLIPPTHTHSPFTNADQRIYMSATLGKGGDLERLTGRHNIDRLPAPDEFKTIGVGRRFFIFANLSLLDEEANSLRLRLQERAGRSVILTPTLEQANEHIGQIENTLGFRVFSKDHIEKDKTPFTTLEKAVVVLANRYDGMDFPGDECRLLCLDGLPKAVNSQERFIMSKMAAPALYNERIQARVLQAIGRCTRELQDRSAVFISGTRLSDFLTDQKKRQYFDPELQAELSFGIDESKNTNANSIHENFEAFINNDPKWFKADNEIRNTIGKYKQKEFPPMNELADVVQDEITYQEAIWNKDYTQALTSARNVLKGLNHPELRGYRALWNYLAGSAASYLSNTPGDRHSQDAQKYFLAAKKAVPTIAWLQVLARPSQTPKDSQEDAQNAETSQQVENIEQNFLSLGIASDVKFKKQLLRIEKELSNPQSFESGQVQLGKILGFYASNNNGNAAPDPWWLGATIGIVFEDNVAAKESTVMTAKKARQAAGHLNWLEENIKGTKEMKIVPVLVTPCTKIASGAAPQLKNVLYWEATKFKEWATSAIATICDLRSEFPGEDNLEWKESASKKLKSKSLTLHSILENIPKASDAMKEAG